ncbi:hypothetical protein [Thermococcus sp.]
MRNATLLFAVIFSTIIAYILAGDIWFALSILLVGGVIYLISVKPSLGGPILYGLFGFLGGFLLAILLGVAIFRNSTIGSYALLSLPIIGSIVALRIGRRGNYRLWFNLRP